MSKTGVAVLIALYGSASYYWFFVAHWGEVHFPENRHPNWLGPGAGYNPCLPPGATDISIAANMESSDYYAAFRFPAEVTDAVWAEAKAAEPALVRYRAPRSYSWWDDDLVRSALAGKGPAVRLCNESGRSFVVVDHEARRGFAWVHR